MYTVYEVCREGKRYDDETKESRMNRLLQAIGNLLSAMRRAVQKRPVTGQPIEYADDELRGRAWRRRD